MNWGISTQYLEVLRTASENALNNKPTNLIRNGIYNLIETYSPQALLRRSWMREKCGFAPEGYAVALTDNSNISCKYCYYKASPNNGGVIDFNKLSIILTEMKEIFGIRFVTLTGGETTLHLREIASRRRDITFFCYTNSVLLNYDYCKDLTRLGNVIPALTIIGGKETHSKIRGDKNYDQVLAAARCLKDLSLIWGFSLTESRVNYDEIVSGGLLDDLLRFKPNFIRMIPYMPVGRGADKWALTSEEYARISALIRSYKSRTIIHDYINDQSLGIPCMAGGIRSFFITEKLEISPCVFMGLSVPIKFSNRSNMRSNIMEIMKSHHYFKNARKLARRHRRCIILENPNWRQEITGRPISA